jgi:tetratricopeptide (TPR) repeat protein
VDRKFQQYMNLSLSSGLDNTIVTSKTRLLENLEEGYLNVIQYTSPQWALKACYRSYEINQEFAHFLKNAPLPDLKPEQKKQYMTIVNQKVQVYLEKADQYRNACVAQAKKWETCDPELSAYFLNPGFSDGHTGAIGFFSPSTGSAEIASGFLRNDTLKQSYHQLLKTPDDLSAMVSLAQAYIGSGDFKQAILVAQKAIGEMKPDQKALQAAAYNVLGVSYLYDHDDTLAKNALKRALETDPSLVSAGINLAGLYRHYGYTQKAEDLYKAHSGINTKQNKDFSIHPRAWELYDENTKMVRK